MLPLTKNEFLFLLSLGFLLIFSFFIIRKTLPIEFFSMIDYVQEKKFILHFIVLLIVITIIVSKLIKMYQNNEKDTPQFKRIIHSLQLAIISFFIAFFAKFDLVFIPFYFILIVSFFIGSI